MDSIAKMSHQRRFTKSHEKTVHCLKTPQPRCINICLEALKYQILALGRTGYQIQLQESLFKDNPITKLFLKRKFSRVKAQSTCESILINGGNTPA